MRLLATCFAAAGLLVSSVSAEAGSVPPFPRLPGSWSHAEINVTINHKPHTMILDRGRIAQVSPTQLTLRERNGVVVQVPLNPRTIVTVYGAAASVYSLKRKMNAQTMRIDGGPAVRVRAGS